MFLNEFKVYQNSNLIEDVNVQNLNFISGDDLKLNTKVFDTSGNFGNRFVKLSAPEINEFKYFSSAAYDGLKNRDRINDTEIKFIHWFLRNQWHRGNRFVIEWSSVLYTCPSCQRHLVKLIEFAEAQGKTIEIRVLAHPAANTINQGK